MSEKNRISSNKIKSKTSIKRGKIFVVQKHYTRNLHYDFRLEEGGVLKSWAIPKEPPTKNGVKRLAVQVEDHPISYAEFQGIIPNGNYGAGKVEIWDNGTFEFLERGKGKYIIQLNGKKMKGRYILIKTAYGKNEWLIFKL